MFDLFGIIASLIVSLLLNVASTLLQSMARQDQKEKVPGVRGQRQVGGINPLGFVVGTYGTVGLFEYGGEWGGATSADTPNAYRTEVFSYSDIPIDGRTALYINGRPVTVASDPDPELGYPVLDFRVDGRDHMWIRDYDGTQVAADPLLLSKFGAHPEKPWLADMRFAGVAYSIVTSLVNRELFTSVPEPMFAMRGIRLYDPRKDSTAGGAGGHRRHDESTWEWTDNPIVIIYNIMLGITFNGEWVWGGQKITPYHLPYANWSAQMDKCDALVSLASGQQVKRFRCGYEISVDQEPQAVIGELLKACEGRIAEIGGIYKVLVAEPGDPIALITDDDIVVTEQQVLDPFPGLEGLINSIAATYPEPAEAWELKEAPPRHSSALEAEDDGRRLSASTEYKAVPYAEQVQWLMRAAIEEARRFRRHTKTMPPEWWEVEPLDTYAWSSARNGYEAKRFLVTALDDLPNGNVFCGSHEIDPADYHWTSDYELPFSVSPLPSTLPPPQLMPGWQVFPARIVGDDGRERPSIRAQFDGSQGDVRAVRVQVRLAETGAGVYDGEVPYGEPTSGNRSTTLNGVFLGNTHYEARGILVPYSGRGTEWSLWFHVLTPDIRIGRDDLYDGVIGFDQLADYVRELQNYIGANARVLTDDMQRIHALVADQDLTNFADVQQLRREARAQYQSITAAYTEQISVAAGPGIAAAVRTEQLEASLGNYAAPGAIATAFDGVQVQVQLVDGKVSSFAEAITAISAASDANNVATANMRFSASAGPAGYAARIAWEARAGGAGNYRSAVVALDVPENPALPSRFVVVAGQMVITDGVNMRQPFVFQGPTAYLQDVRIGTAVIDDGAVTNLKIGPNAVSIEKLIAGATMNERSNYVPSIPSGSGATPQGGTLIFVSGMNVAYGTVTVHFSANILGGITTAGAGTCQYDLLVDGVPFGGVRRHQTYDVGGGSHRYEGATGAVWRVSGLAPGNHFFAVRNHPDSSSFMSGVGFSLIVQELRNRE